MGNPANPHCPACGRVLASIGRLDVECCRSCQLEEEDGVAVPSTVMLDGEELAVCCTVATVYRKHRKLVPEDVA